MSLFYSPAQGGFFDDTLHGEMPADARPITAATHAALLAAQAAGQRIIAGPDGDPIAVDPETLLTDADRFRQLRARRNDLLRDSDHTQLADFPATEQQRADWASYRQALRDLPESCGEAPEAAVWPVPPSTTGDDA